MSKHHHALNNAAQAEQMIQHMLAAPQPPKVQPIDLQAVREVIDELLSQPFIDRSHEWRAEIANKLSRAIGDTP